MGGRKRPEGQKHNAWCDLTVNGDKMVGTIDTDKGTIEFVKGAPAKSRR